MKQRPQQTTRRRRQPKGHHINSNKQKQKQTNTKRNACLKTTKLKITNKCGNKTMKHIDNPSQSKSGSEYHAKQVRLTCIKEQGKEKITKHVSHDPIMKQFKTKPRPTKSPGETKLRLCLNKKKNKCKTNKNANRRYMYMYV